VGLGVTDRTAGRQRTAIADGREISRAGLRTLLEHEPDFEVVGEATDRISSLTLVRQLQPDLLLLDPTISGTAGLDALRDLSSATPSCAILLLMAAIDKSDIIEALQLGARGIVPSSAGAGLLLKAIRAVIAGEFWITRRDVADLAIYLRQSLVARSSKITPREIRIIAAVVAGYPNKLLAERFSISEDTVTHCLSCVFGKLGVSNRLELALFAIKHHLVPDSSAIL